MTSRDLQRTVALNRDTAAHWEVFAPHRARVTRLILERSGRGVGRVAILGCGNCNDVDLQAILTRADVIDLIDLDESAVRCGVARQQLVGSTRVIVHAPVDVTGGAVRSSNDGDRVPTLPHAGRCDLVVSTCLLSALIASALDHRGAEDPATLKLVTGVRDQHLTVLGRHVRPGGRILLVSDLVSSDTCPEILTADAGALREFMMRALQARNFFTGTNPIVVAARIGEILSGVVDEVRVLAPWRWPISPSRAYLVYAIDASIRVDGGVRSRC